jgi:multidrug/hemolysin transport system ATP-binding protein
MEEAAESDNIVIINKGEIRAEGTPAKLKDEYCTDHMRVQFKNGETAENTLARTVDAIPFIEAHKSEIANIEIVNGTLDDVFLNLTDGGNKNAD